MPFKSDEKTCFAKILDYLGQNSGNDLALAYLMDLYVVKSGIKHCLDFGPNAARFCLDRFSHYFRRA